MRNPEETIGKLADKQGVSFIGSIDADGFPNLKAMLPPRKREGIRRFWFTTNTASMRVAQFRTNPKGCVYFCDRRFYRGVMLRGHFEVLEDEASKELIWQDGDTETPPRCTGVQAKPYLFCNARGEAWTPKSIGRRIAQRLDGRDGFKPP